MKPILYTCTALVAVLTVTACGTSGTSKKDDMSATETPTTGIPASASADISKNKTLDEINRRSTEVEIREQSISAKEAQLAEHLQSLSAQESKLSEKQKALELTTQELEQLKQKTAATQMAGSPMLPPNAEPGRCYGRLYVPPQYKTISEQVLKRSASERIQIVPAKYASVNEKVMIQEPVTKLKVIPATYKTIQERVEKVPASQKVVEVPAVYETVSERIMVKPAHTVWKRGTGPIQKINEATGEIMCLVEVPASYKTISKRVLKTPATTRVVEIPAVYETIKKRIVDTPSTTAETTIPAKYKMMKVTKLVEPAREKRIEIPEEHQSLTKTVLVSEGQMQWREILCETNMTNNRIAQVQKALLKVGHNPGPVDGVIGAQTMDAVNAFQKSKGLPVDKYLDIATIKALGVNPR